MIKARTHTHTHTQLYLVNSKLQGWTPFIIMRQEKQWHRRQPARGLFNPQIYTTADLKKKKGQDTKLSKTPRKNSYFKRSARSFGLIFAQEHTRKKKLCKYEQQYDLLKAHFLFSLLDPTYKAIKTALLFHAVQVRASLKKKIRTIRKKGKKVNYYC